MKKLYRFALGDKEVNCIAVSEEAARQKSKLSVEFQLKSTYLLSKEWQ